MLLSPPCKGRAAQPSPWGEAPQASAVTGTEELCSIPYLHGRAVLDSVWLLSFTNWWKYFTSLS